MDDMDKVFIDSIVHTMSMSVDDAGMGLNEDLDLLLQYGIDEETAVKIISSVFACGILVYRHFGIPEWLDKCIKDSTNSREHK